MFFEVLEKICSEGLPAELVEAAINRHEFRLREAEFGYPKGLVYNMISLDSWLYDSDPLLHISFEKTIEQIRKESTEGMFEDLIREYILNNTHHICITAVPVPGLTEKNEKRLAEELASVKDKMSDTELEMLINDTRRLKTRQQSRDTRESLESIPLLKKEDIRRKAEILPIEDIDIAGTRSFYHKHDTNGITYLRAYFDTSVIKKEDIPYIKLLSGLLSRISTESHSYGDLSNRINRDTGGLEFTPWISVDHKDADKYTPYLIVKGKSLEDRTSELVTLVQEIITGTVFDEHGRLAEVIRELKSRFEMSMMNNGHVFSARRAFSRQNRSGAYEELVEGISYYVFLNELEKGLDYNIRTTAEKLKDVASRIFTKNNVFLSYTGSENSLDKYRADLEKLVGAMDSVHSVPASLDFTAENTVEGVLAPAQIQYVSMTGNFRKKGFDYNGGYRVFKTIIGMDYLWNRVRVLGGAYGAFIRIESDGKVSLQSYRDPNIDDTLKAYRNIASYLREFSADERELRKYMIGTVSELDRHLNCWQKAEASVKNRISGKTPEIIQQERDEVLSFDLSLLDDMAELIDSVTSGNNVCVFGNESRIKQNSEFKKLTEIFR